MNSKGVHLESTKFEQYVIVVKNCTIIWRVSSSKTSIVAVAVAAGAIPNPVSTTVTGVLSGAEGGTLVSPEVNWVRSYLISEVTKGAQDLEL